MKNANLVKYVTVFLAVVVQYVIFIHVNVVQNVTQFDANAAKDALVILANVVLNVNPPHVNAVQIVKHFHANVVPYVI
jgi:hypothetical protein